MTSNEEIFAAMAAKMQKTKNKFSEDLIGASAALVQSEVVQELTEVYKSKIDSQTPPKKLEQKSIVRGK